MTCRSHFTKSDLASGCSSRPPERARAIVPKPTRRVKGEFDQIWLRLHAGRERRPRRDGLLALNRKYCGRTWPLRVNLRRFWPPGAVVVARLAVPRG